jgi:hypothetical protein
MRVNKSWWLVFFFLIGGIAFWVTMPEIWIGQIWVAVSVFLGVVYLAVGHFTNITDAFKSGQPGAGNITVDSSLGGSAVVGPGSDAGQAVMETLKQYGIDPKTGTIDLRNLPAAREAVMQALKDHGVDVAHQVAAAYPTTPIVAAAAGGEPVERMTKLKQLRDAGLISPAEFETNKKRILEQL